MCMFIAVFLLGAVSGLLCFSRLLHWLLQRFHQATMALLTGFLFGSLTVVWPWKRVLSWVEDRHGEMKAVQQWPVTPGDFQAYTGQEPQVLLCLALMAFGFVLVLMIHALSGNFKQV